MTIATEGGKEGDSSRTSLVSPLVDDFLRIPEPFSPAVFLPLCLDPREKLAPLEQLPFAPPSSQERHPFPSPANSSIRALFGPLNSPPSSVVVVALLSCGPANFLSFLSLWLFSLGEFSPCLFPKALVVPSRPSRDRRSLPFS